MTRPFRWGESGLGVPLYHWGHLWDVREGQALEDRLRDPDHPWTIEEAAEMAVTECGSVETAMQMIAAMVERPDVATGERTLSYNVLRYLAALHPEEGRRLLADLRREEM